MVAITFDSRKISSIIFCTLFPWTTSSPFKSIEHEHHNESDAIVLAQWNKIMHGYDRLVRPNYAGSPTTVYVGMTVLQFRHINELDMSFKVDLFLRQQWYDNRLKHGLNESITILLGRDSPADYLWVPDTVFINSKDATHHTVTVNNDKLDIAPSGKVFWGTRVSVLASCNLDLKDYPLDTQTCHIGLESYTYPIDHVVFAWTAKTVIFNSEMAQFFLLDHHIVAINESFGSNIYSTLRAGFTLKRRIACSIIQIFFPTISVVVVSWVPLWIQKKASSARLGLGVTTLLTLCTFWSGVNLRLPLVSYIKAVDLYFMVSFCFILCTLVEYTLVLNLDYYKLLLNRSGENRKVERKTKRKVHMNNAFERSKAENLHKRRKSVVDTYERGELLELIELEYEGSVAAVTYATQEEERKDQTLIEFEDATRTPFLDLISRFLFPVGFTLFNVYFWLSYNN